MPRRRQDVLLPLEEAVLVSGLGRLRDGHPDFHGFALARDLDRVGGSRLTAHGTLYKTLERLERGGLLTSRWEDPADVDGSRPRRRLYRVTDDAAAALERSRRVSLAAISDRSGVAST